MTNLNSREVQLTLCEKCNLNCVYCYEHNKDTSVMDFALAKKIITEEFEHAKSKGIDSLSLSFHGGEIALVFDRLKEICEWLWNKDWDLKYSCSAATNGTFIHGDIQKWFEKNSDKFTLGLSLDGDKYSHDRNRSNSFDMIDLDYFLKNYPKTLVKMTISPYTIENLSADIKFIVKKGFLLTANLAYGCNWGNDLFKRIYAKELLILSDFFLANPHLKPPHNLLQRKITGFGLAVYENKTVAPKKSCGTGQQMCCYDMEGNRHPCQMFMPSSSGKFNFDGCIINDEDILYAPECKQCPIFPLCSNCYGFNFTQYGDLIQRYNDMCDYQMIEWFNYSYFLFKMLQNKEEYSLTKDLSDVEVALNLKAIIDIQKRLNSSRISNYIV